MNSPAMLIARLTLMCICDLLAIIAYALHMAGMVPWGYALGLLVVGFVVGPDMAHMHEVRDALREHRRRRPKPRL